MRRATTAVLAASVGAALLGSTGAAEACGSCRGPVGPGAAFTAPYERWGVVMAATGRVAHGSWTSSGDYHTLGDASSDRSFDFTLGGAYRPIPALEVAAALSAGRGVVIGPGLASTRTSLGDTTLRLRWEPIAEPAFDVPGEMSWPSVGLALSVRMPTGSSAPDSPSDGSSSSAVVGSSASSQGLGTWEFALSADVRRTFGQYFQLGVVGEGALRLPDDAIGIDRALGPRLIGRLVALVLPSNRTAAGIYADMAWEGNISYGGRVAEASAQRRGGLGVMASYNSDHGLRSGIALGYDPPIPGLGANTNGNTTLSVNVGYTR